MIDYKELSVGDWVIYTEFDKQVIDRVECVEKNRVYLEHAKLYTPINYIEPIPLIGEILVHIVDDVKDFGQGDIGLYFDKNYIELKACRGAGEMAIWFDWEEHNDGVFADYILPRPTYVHELQHALRLCGIDKEIEL